MANIETPQLMNDYEKGFFNDCIKKHFEVGTPLTAKQAALWERMRTREAKFANFLSMLNLHLLNETEKNFILHTVKGTYYHGWKLTDKQQMWLNNIIEKCHK